jgi:3,4-dehydroadipyl-CoA semialdehyde dehydrogenase
MQTLSSYVSGKWQEGAGEGAVLVNPVTEEPLATTSTDGLDFAAAAAFGREQGGAALRAMTFGERAALLKAMSKSLHAHRDALLDLAIQNGGNTRSDGKFDVDGATGTLAAYAFLGKDLGDRKLLLEGAGVQLGRSSRYWGQHILSPREGVAVLINAFNFPAWGWAEKAACSLLAGVPVIVKPASSTALLTFRMVEILVEDGVLPAGALQLVSGGPGDLLDHLTEQDVVAFTGSAATGRRIRAHQNLIHRGVKVNVEADSLNSAILAPGLDPDGDTSRLFLREVAKEMTQKAGQKCTAVRRILVPTDDLERVRDELAAALEAVVVGDPSRSEVRMGPLTTAAQLADARCGIETLAGEGRIVTGGPEPVDAVGVEGGKGYFVQPTLIENTDPANSTEVHRLEVFGPVATIMPYDGTPAMAADLVRRGEGSLVSAAYGDDVSFIGELITGLAPWNGRLYLGSEKVADMAVGSGAALPFLKHGGPGRAGGGAELGGLSGLRLYQQRTAVQGDRGLLNRVLPGKD